MPKPNLSNGFTLIEILITVAVVAVTLSVAVPTFTKLIEKKRIVGAAETIGANLAYARSEAIKRNTAISVSFDNGSPWSYGISDAGDCSTTVSACRINTASGTSFIVNNASYKNVVLAANFTGTPKTVTFNSRRGIANNGTVVLTMGNNSLSVVVSILGHVTVCATNATSASRLSYDVCV